MTPWPDDWNAGRRTLSIAPVFSDHMVLQRESPIPIWGTAGPGEDVRITLGSMEKRTRSGHDGKWSVTFDPVFSDEPLAIKVESPGGRIEIRDVLMGEVWLCSGQSNMEFVLAQDKEAGKFVAGATDPLIRHLSVPRVVSHHPLPTFDARWKVCTPETAGGFSAVGYHCATGLRKKLGVPVGLVTSAYGGASGESWLRTDCLEGDPVLSPILRAWERFVRDYPEDPEVRKAVAEANAARMVAEGKTPPPWPMEPLGPDHFNRPGLLFNSMIHPLVPFPFRGVLWYQGEGNSSRAQQYRRLLPALIADWRRLWNRPDLWFLLVQLPNFDAPWLERDVFAEMREAQAVVARDTPGTGMVCTIDLGESEEIHPPRKAPVGERLSRLALSRVYGQTVPCSGPVFRSMEVRKDGILIRFDHAEGLHATGAEPLGFSIAGRDRKFVPARAVIEGECVRAGSGEVGEPVAVRYAWSNDPRVNMYNKAGFPAHPFRTDEWPGVTDGCFDPGAC